MSRTLCIEIPSFVRGYHAYQDQWLPVAGQLLLLRREPSNPHDRNSVAVVKTDGTVVGHIPYVIAPILSSFLARDSNEGKVEITGGRVNRGAGYGLEVPCIYRLYGQKKYIDRVKELLSTLEDNGISPSP